MKTATLCVQAGTQRDPIFAGVNTPLHTSSSFDFPNDQNVSYYPRYFNTPNHIAVAQKMAELENAEAALITSSGMAAISSALLGVLKSGDHAIFQSVIYGGTHRFLDAVLPRFGITYSFTTGFDVSDFAKLIQKNTRLIYVETPSNPLLDIVDVAAIAELAKSRQLISMIDNTFATPINQRPLDLGFDIVVHSGTKYLGGHSDLCCGVIATSQKKAEQILPFLQDMGSSLDVHALALLERSLKTLSLRVRQHNTNALQVAQFLATHSKIKNVFYPGLETHPGYAIAKKQMVGFGGMLSYEMKNNGPTMSEFFSRLKIIRPASSLGGVESLICQPSKTSHAEVPPEERIKMGILDTLFRLSVGIEDVDDLIEDLKGAI